jgi:hypothetical protein
MALPNGHYLDFDTATPEELAMLMRVYRRPYSQYHGEPTGRIN